MYLCNMQRQNKKQTSTEASPKPFTFNSQQFWGLFFFLLFWAVIFLRRELSSGLEMVATKHCLKVCCGTDQTKETSSCHLESAWEVEQRQVRGGDQKHPDTASTVQRDGAGNNLWWSIPGIHENWLGMRLCLAPGRWAAPAGTAARASPGGRNWAAASSKLSSLLNHSTSLLSRLFFSSHLFHVYSGLEPHRFAAGTEPSGFPLFFFLTWPQIQQTKFSKKIQSTSYWLPQHLKKPQPPKDLLPTLYSPGASTILPISREAERFSFF